METRRLGGTDLELSVIGLGTWAFGGRWGGADDEASLATCHAAIDAGVNWIDTADIYGQGRAERVVGRSCASEPARSMVATKGGVAWETDPAFRIWREASGRLPEDGLRPQPPGPRAGPHRPLPGPLAGRRGARRGHHRGAARPARRRQDPGDRGLELRPGRPRGHGGRRPHRLLPARVPRVPARHRGRRAAVVRRARRRGDRLRAAGARAAHREDVRRHDLPRRRLARAQRAVRRRGLPAPRRGRGGDGGHRPARPAVPGASPSWPWRGCCAGPR